MDNRTRKAPSQFARQEWRNKAAGNSAQLRYSRELILRNYKNLKSPCFVSSSELSDYVLIHPSPPLLTAIFPFSHSLGEEVNSRKHLGREKRVEQMPEWYEEEEPKETISKTASSLEDNEKVFNKEEPNKDFKVILTSKHVKNLALEEYKDKDLEDMFSKIDLKVEEKLKKEVVEDEYAEPEWDDPVDEDFVFGSIQQEIKKPVKEEKPEQVLPLIKPSEAPPQVSRVLNQSAPSVPKASEAGKQQKLASPVFDINLLRYHQAIRNPFIQILMDYGVPYGKNSMTFTHGSKPFEKIWFYKDLDRNVQGPFSTLEMFAWTIRDCFPSDLEISIGTPNFFVPMNIFNECCQFEKEEIEDEAPAVISDSVFSLYDSKQLPPDVISLDDLESAQVGIKKIEDRGKEEKIGNVGKNEKMEKIELLENSLVEQKGFDEKVEKEEKFVKIEKSSHFVENAEKNEISEKFEKIVENSKYDKRNKQEKRGKFERVDDKDKGKARTLEEIEKMQQGRVGKMIDSSSPMLQKSMKTNEAATFELKNILGLITKK
jgi:hypothetical protein